MATTGPLSEPTILVSPQAAGPAVPEESVQEAFRGVVACQRTGYGSPPGKAQGFRGQDTVERHDGLDIVMEKVLQWEAEIVDPSCSGGGCGVAFKLQEFGVTLCRHWFSSKNPVNSLCKSIVTDSENGCNLPLVRKCGLAEFVGPRWIDVRL